MFIERFDNYTKQTYRNRCMLYSANGELMLNIPVEKGRSRKMKMKDVRIAYHTDWQKIHWKSIESAYRSSPFFEFYVDDFIPFYTKTFDFLFDYTFQMHRVVAGHLELENEIRFTDDFEKQVENDFRYVIHPKKNSVGLDNAFRPLEYRQVFAEKYGFIPNLSIIDLLFNEGPNAVSVLNDCIQ